MYNHEPSGYDCPFCNLVDGGERRHNSQSDIVLRNEYALATIAPKWWDSSPGHVLVVPTKHYENIYDIPDDILAEVYKLTKRVAIAMRATYDCDGTSTRQHNEPGGGQDVWHLHVHIYARKHGDRLYQNHDKKSFVELDKRSPYSQRLKEYFAKHSG